MVLGPTVSLSVIAHSDESRHVDPDTGMETYGEEKSWSSGPTTMLAVGICTFILGFVSLFFVGSILNWFVDPRILE